MIAALLASAVLMVPLPSPMPSLHHAKCPWPTPDERGVQQKAAGCFEKESFSAYHDGDRFTIYHELGHAFDHQRMDQGERNRFARLHYFPRGTKWLDYSDDSPGETFADIYAACLMGYKEFRNTCRFITRAADRKD